MSLTSRRELVRIAVLIVIGFASLFAMTFWPAGTWHWREGWILIALIFGGWLAGTLLVARYQPELIGRRTRIGKGTKRWDVVLLGVLKVVFLGLIVLPAFGIRFDWPQLDAGFVWIGVALYVAGHALLLWAMLVNPHFESTVRIQEDREHRVIDTGPYARVRHPGYVGFLVLTVGIPLVLRSLWGYPFALVVLIWIFVRTSLEDRLLRRELHGYEDYVQRVRHRLIPGVW